MPSPDRRPRIDETDAKAGSNEGVVRWVLAISLGLAIIALTVIWVTGALTQGPVESQMNVERKIEARQEQNSPRDSSIDGVTASDAEAGDPPVTADR